jgi:hypothetical protein
MRKTLLFLVFLSFSLRLLAQTDSLAAFTGTIAQMRAISGKPYKHASSTDYGTGNWFKDMSDHTSVDNTGTVLIDADGNRWKRIFTGPISVNWFGAVGDGVTNDQTAIQNCFSQAKEFQTVSFEKGTYKFTSVTLTKPNVNILGYKANLLGTINIGDDTLRTYSATFSGLTFTQTGNAIQIKNCRKLKISGNVFNGCDKSVYVKPEGGGVHYNAMIEITDANYFNDVNYCFYVDRASAASWMTTSDCTFSGNVANNTLITAVYCNGIDGLRYLGNTIFMPSTVSQRVNKKNHLKIDKQSDWVVVANNNFFESGEESVLVENCKNLNVTGNNFAWCGQKGVYSLIRAAGTITDLAMNISGNIINKFSGNVVEIDSTTYGQVNVTANTINYANTFTNYFGTQNLSLITHYIIRAGNAFTQIFQKNNYNAISNLKVFYKTGVVSNTEPWGSYVAESNISKSLTTINNTTPVNLLGLLDAASNTTTYGGVIVINAKNAATSSANTTTYYIMVNKSSTSTSPEVSIIARLGLIAGAGASHPSFTFTISGNRLYATPVNATSGTFYFYAKADGNLILTE